jgi:hypothetical protein
MSIGRPKDYKHMTSTLVYTFRTNKCLSEFHKASLEVFVFGKLKEDLTKFRLLIEKTQPKHIIGLAEVKTQSRLETLAINAFGRNGKVSKNGKDSYSLYALSGMTFSKSKKPTSAFCNWTTYKISELINPKHTKISFIHFNQDDLLKVLDFIKV